MVDRVDDGSSVAEGPRIEGGRLGELYLRHGRNAVRLAYLLTGDRHLAEDLVQDAFARLAGRFVDLRAPDAFEAYLRRMVVNLARMHFRRRRLERLHLQRKATLQREDVLVDGRGSAYGIGYTESSEASLHATVGPDLTFNGNVDGFIAKISRPRRT